jgi:pimeloyl-[acyl-carrier protein] methyl ester esterase
MSTVSVESVGDGPPLVLLHGWAMHSGVWGAIVAQLAQHYRVHLVDLPGHGRSTPIEPCTLDGMVAAVDSALEAEARPLAVLGWSMGGLVAMRWALACPDRVHRLILLCTTPRYVAGPDWPHAMAPETLARFADELRVSWKATVQRFLALQVHNSEHGRAALVEMREQLWTRGEPSRSVLSATLDVLATSDLRVEAARISQPTLVIAGGRDTLCLPAAGRWLGWTIPGARFEEIQGAGHAPFLSHRVRLAAMLEDFLGSR